MLKESIIVYLSFPLLKNIQVVLQFFLISNGDRHNDTYFGVSILIYTQDKLLVELLGLKILNIYKYCHTTPQKATSMTTKKM